MRCYTAIISPRVRPIVGYWCPIKSNNYFFTVKSLWAGNITKFYNVRELSVNHEFWPTIADWFKLV